MRACLCACVCVCLESQLYRFPVDNYYFSFNRAITAGKIQVHATVPHSTLMNQQEAGEKADTKHSQMKRAPGGAQTEQRVMLSHALSPSKSEQRKDRG